MNDYVEKEKSIARTLNQFLHDVNEAEELDLSEFSDDFEKIEEEIDNCVDRLDDMASSDDEDDSEYDEEDNDDDH
uniref:Phage protein n=1 Tax=Panagrolaimus sp. ES5 TaxID=591445 RepID=A0AC34FTE8_9BILA